MSDVQVILNNPNISRIYAAVMKNFKLDAVIGEDDDPGKCEAEFNRNQPKLTLIGSKFFQKNSTTSQKAVINSIVKWYVAKKAVIKDAKNLIFVPVIIACEKAEMEILNYFPQINMRKLVLPTSTNNTSLDNLINKDFRRILYELKIQLPAYDAPRASKEVMEDFKPE